MRLDHTTAVTKVITRGGREREGGRAYVAAVDDRPRFLSGVDVTWRKALSGDVHQSSSGVTSVGLLAEPGVGVLVVSQVRQDLLRASLVSAGLLRTMLVVGTIQLQSESIAWCVVLCRILEGSAVGHRKLLLSERRGIYDPHPVRRWRGPVTLQWWTSDDIRLSPISLLEPVLLLLLLLLLLWGWAWGGVVGTGEAYLLKRLCRLLDILCRREVGWYRVIREVVDPLGVAKQRSKLSG